MIPKSGYAKSSGMAFANPLYTQRAGLGRYGRLARDRSLLALR